MTQAKKIRLIISSLVSIVVVFLLRVWWEDKLHKLPDFLLVLSGVMIPVAVVLLAVYFASKKPGPKKPGQ